MWTCRCDEKNSLTNLECCRCGMNIPQYERDRIYKEQLEYAQKKQFDGIMKPTVAFSKDALKYAKTYGKILLEKIWDFIQELQNR